MRLTGSIFNNGSAFRQRRRHHDVHGGAHRHHIQIDIGAVQMAVFGPGIDIAALHGHLGAHGGKALDMLVDGPHTEIAAAGHSHRSLAKTAQQRAQQVIAGPDAPRQFIAGAGGTNNMAIQFHRMAVQHPHLNAQFIQNGEKQRHVTDLGNVFDPAYAIYHQSSGNDRYRRVFRTADGHLAIQGVATVHNILIQNLHPLFRLITKPRAAMEDRRRKLCPTLIIPTAENFIHHIV